jgi:hypothetical protein
MEATPRSAAAIFLIALGRPVRCQVVTERIEGFPLFRPGRRALSVPIPPRAILFGSKFGSEVVISRLAKNA